MPRCWTDEKVVVTGGLMENGWLENVEEREEEKEEEEKKIEEKFGNFLEKIGFRDLLSLGEVKIKNFE